MQQPPVPPLATTSLLMRVQRSCRTAMDGALQVHGLSIAQYSVLRRLEDAPGLSGAELARRLFVTAQTINRLIAALESAALIERFPDAGNPRILRARLTDAGREAVVAGRRTVEAVEARWLAGLDLHAQMQFTTWLRHCVEALEGPVRPASAPTDWEPRLIGGATESAADG